MEMRASADNFDYLAGLRLDGKGAVVVGAGQGIGEQSAVALSQAGAHVFCVDRDIELAQRVADRVGGTAYKADVTSRADTAQLFQDAKSSLGRVDVVVNVVGAAHIGPLVETDDVTWDRQFDIVLRHAYLSIQYGAEAMAAGGGGSFAFVGAMAAHHAVPNMTAYAVSKAALHHLIRCSAAEYAHRGVRINGIAPGYVRTPRLAARLDDVAWAAIRKVIPLGREATPEDVAGPLLFLASGMSAYITGEIIGVHGGAGVLAPYPDVKYGPAATVNAQAATK